MYFRPMHWLSVLFFSLSLPSFAAQTFYCPVNYGTIRVGMSQAEVTKFCGAPTNTKTEKVFSSKTAPVKQYYYRVGGFRLNPRNLGAQDQSTTVSSTSIMVISVMNGKVSAISVDGSTMPSATVCQGPVSVGMSAASATRACGQPYMVNQTKTNVGDLKQVKKITWFYQFTPYQSVTLTFQDDILQSISP